MAENKKEMKKIVVLAVSVVCAACAMAQTKIAYLDLYQRGGAQHLRTTLTFNGTKMWCGKMTLGQALNMLAEDGWVVDQTLIGARRVGLMTYYFTRHKFHIILKKEYQPGEDPFGSLLTHGYKFVDDPQSTDASQNKNRTNIIGAVNIQSLKSLSQELRTKYYELKKNKSSIPGNIDEFESKVNEYVAKYEVLYNCKAPEYLPERQYLKLLKGKLHGN